tara:strand:- start:3244 stop:3471 length:228 start_codon:yes stop_codon:yes gene_type:complete
MKYSKELVDKIYTSKISDIEKINQLLEMDATQYTNCGIDSTELELEVVRLNSDYIYKTIKKIDPWMGESFLKHKD